MTPVSILTCWSFALAQWQTVVLMQDAKGYGVVKDYATNEDYSERIGFIKADGEMVCIIK